MEEYSCISVEEAKKLTAAAHEEIKLKQKAAIDYKLKEINNMIKNAAKKGDIWCANSLNPEIATQVIAKLKELGFSVEKVQDATFGRRSSEVLIKISWED